MIIERNDNGPLYFVVGALLVAVAAFAIFYFSGERRADTDIASGTARVENVAPAAGEAANTSMNAGRGTTAPVTQPQP